MATPIGVFSRLMRLWIVVTFLYVLLSYVHYAQLKAKFTTRIAENDIQGFTEYLNITTVQPHQPENVTTQHVHSQILPEIDPMDEKIDNLKYFTDYYQRMCTYIEIKNNLQDLNLCKCIPDELGGAFEVDTYNVPPKTKLILNRTELGAGGKWTPEDCTPRQHVAIIIPFRDREKHLLILLRYLHPMLQRQKIKYQIFVVEQIGEDQYNKGISMSAGFVEAMKLEKFDCIIFHDVDLVPEDDRNMYTCTKFVRHLTPYISKFNYQLPYWAVFGGAISLTPEQFRLTNGFSTLFYGWGGEDDDMRRRVVAQKLSILRYPKTVCRYKSIWHSSDKLNPKLPGRWNIVFQQEGKHGSNGLNTLKYQLKVIEFSHLYTWLLIEIPAAP